MNTFFRTALPLAMTLICTLGAPAANARTKAKKPAAVTETKPVAAQAAAPEVVEPVEEKLEDLPNPEKSCKKDVETFCAKVKPGNNQLAACLRGHKDEIADGCKKALYDYLKKRFDQSCKSDVKKYCQKESTQQGGLMPCLQKNGEQLSAGCQEMVGIKKPAAPTATPAK